LSIITLNRKNRLFTQIKNKTALFIATAFTILTITMAQNNKPATDFMAVPGPIVFDSKAYNLNWSSHPAANFYKQEYLVKGENEDKYKTMLLIDAITGQQELKDVVRTKVAELKKMKEGNPVINYEIIQNPKTSEYMLDFLLTVNAADGSISIIERNVYRYKAFTDKAGKKAVMLLGVSTRAYGAAAANQLLIALKASRKELMNKVAQFKIPELNINN